MLYFLQMLNMQEKIKIILVHGESRTNGEIAIIFNERYSDRYAYIQQFRPYEHILIRNIEYQDHLLPNFSTIFRNKLCKSVKSFMQP